MTSAVYKQCSRYHTANLRLRVPYWVDRTTCGPENKYLLVISLLEPIHGLGIALAHNIERRHNTQEQATYDLTELGHRANCDVTTVGLLMSD